MTIRMTAKKSFLYAGKRLQAGQEFDARTQSDARLLSAIGNASVCQSPIIQTPAAAPIVLKAVETVPPVLNAEPAIEAPASNAEPVTSTAIDAPSEFAERVKRPYTRRTHQQDSE